MNRIVVAIDGPSGSGKSTVARAVASACGLGYLDTGAMYRAVAWWLMRQGVDLADPVAAPAAVKGADLRISTDPANQRIEIGGRDVTEAIRTTEVSSQVSRLATNLPARAEMVALQQRIVAGERQRRGVVVEGRDITTVIAPDAEVRLLLTASEEARLRRRAAELHAEVDAAAVEATKDQVLRRDRDDATVASFMTAADGVTTLDTSGYTKDETIAIVTDLVRAAQLAGGDAAAGEAPDETTRAAARPAAGNVGGRPVEAGDLA